MSGRTTVAAINADGTLDAAFSANLTGGVSSTTDLRLVAHTRNGQPGFVVGGAFHTFAGVSVSGVARINADGTIDPDFNVDGVPTGGGDGGW